MTTVNTNFKVKNGLDAVGTITGLDLVSTASSGNEGGEIRLATAATGSTLTAGTVTIDVYQNKLRIFETGGTNRGAYIDLSAATTEVGSNLLSGGGGGAGIGSTIFPNRSGYWITNCATFSNANGATAGLNVLMYSPFILTASTTFSAIGINVGTGTTNATVRLGVYNADANGTPTTLVFDAGIVAAATGGAKQITIDQTLSAGNYCLALVPQTATPASISYISQPTLTLPAVGLVTIPVNLGFNQTGVTGALPSTVGTLVAQNTPLSCGYGMVRLKVA